MSVRGELSRKKILEASRKLFASKGFFAVSMQDICDATGLSRGGLYRHYKSTEEVFSAIIRDEQTEAFASLEKAKAIGVPPDKLLISFLRSRMAQLLDPSVSIDNAIAELAKASERSKELLQNRAIACVDITSRMLELGVAQGIFSCDNCKEVALHIIWSLEGMGKHNLLLPLTQKDIDAQLKLILRMVNKKLPSYEEASTS